jgi:hypothetical protein
MTIAIIIVALIAAFLVYVATRPNSFQLQRSIVIDTPPDKPFALVNDFHQWTRWSPFDNIDADLKRTFEGAPAGKGAVYGWEGKKSGAGRMEILESAPAAKVLIKLDFIKPFEAHNTATFTFVPVGNTTTATWTMTGPMKFMNKLMTTFMSMEKMVGGQFEQGLASMKTEAEKA